MPKASRNPIPVIDLFAGPGGLAEGFARVAEPDGRPSFNILLSVEKDAYAHQTLELRALYRHIKTCGQTRGYYDYLRSAASSAAEARSSLFREHPEAADAARAEAWRLELGPANRRTVSARVDSRLSSYPPGQPWILLGGPPCQAYSIAGRSRMRPVLGSEFDSDRRHTLYREYLAILRAHRPTLFFMENVKGLLSSTIRSEHLFQLILRDLCNAAGPSSYRLFSLTQPVTAALLADKSFLPAPEDFVIECERYGIPQTRHRIIILGIRSDVLSTRRGYSPPILQKQKQEVSARRVLEFLPRIRSGLTRINDDAETWRDVQLAALSAPWLNGTTDPDMVRVIERACAVLRDVRLPRANRGGRYVPWPTPRIQYRPRWYLAPGLEGVCNHEARDHMPSDLHRYLFASCFAHVHRRTPKLRDFPRPLLPNHSNVNKALSYGNFNDRFRVQIWDSPSTTIVSHIAKDGHYYIHPDSTQCRSLTVREAARLQTFPDNYFFEGPRTAQYKQVGNAVPPLLALQLGTLARRVLSELGV